LLSKLNHIAKNCRIKTPSTNKYVVFDVTRQVTKKFCKQKAQKIMKVAVFVKKQITWIKIVSSGKTKTRSLTMKK